MLKGDMQLMCHLGGRTGMRGGPRLGEGYCESRCCGRQALLGNNAYSSVHDDRAAASSPAAIEIKWLDLGPGSVAKPRTPGCITNC